MTPGYFSHLLLIIASDSISFHRFLESFSCDISSKRWNPITVDHGEGRCCGGGTEYSTSPLWYFFLDIFACNKHIWGHDHLALPSISVSLRQIFHFKVFWCAAYTPLGFHHRWGDSFAFRTFQIMDQLQQGLWQVFVCSVSKCLTKSMKYSMSWMLALFISGERPYSTGELQFFW